MKWIAIKNISSWLWEYKAHIALVVFAIGAFLYLQHREEMAYTRGVNETKANFAVAELNVRKENAVHLNKIRRLDDTELVRRFCASSVFDAPVDVCVRSNPLIQ